MTLWLDPHAPETPLEALMQAGPFDEPVESKLEHELKVEALRNAMDEVLDEREKWVIESIFWRRRGLRLLSRELSLSKTHVARIRDSALKKLLNHLTGGTNP